MTGLFITARLGASRLPGKMMAPICGKPVIDLVMERVQYSKGIDHVILCTTTGPEDDALVTLAKARNINVFRGSPEDVLVRYQGAAKTFNIKNIVIADGDDPFCEPQMVTKVAEILQSAQADYVTIKDMPYGTYPYGMTTEALNKVCDMKDESETEGWGRYFTQTGIFRIHTLEAPENWRHPEYRMTLDYEEDLEFIKTVYERLYKPNRPLLLDEVFTLLENEPDIPAINLGRQEEYNQRFKKKYSHVKLKKDVL